MVRARILGAIAAAVSAAATGIVIRNADPRVVYDRRWTVAEGVDSTEFMTLFSMPKSTIEDREDSLRAIRSWVALDQEVILLGDTPETADLAREVGLGNQYRPIGIRHNALGTPLVDDIFRAVLARASSDVLAYINADIVLGRDLISAAVTARAAFKGRPFLMVGRRTDAGTDSRAFGDGCDVETNARTGLCGRLHPASGKDWFVFSRDGVFDGDHIPPFSLGRTIWDNWLVADALRRRIPVIDATDAVVAVHLEHGYNIGERNGVQRETGEWSPLVGREASINRALAGGSELVLGGSIGAATHRLQREERIDGTWYIVSERYLPMPLWTWLSDLPFFLGYRGGSSSSPYLAIATMHIKSLLRCAFPSGLINRSALRVATTQHLVDFQRSVQSN